jgi:hypothetical protein
MEKNYPVEFKANLSRKFISKEITKDKDSSKIRYSLEIGGKGEIFVKYSYKLMNFVTFIISGW